MARRSLSLSKVYSLLEPGPVVMLTTAHKGKANVMTMSWLTMMELEPPLIGCIVSGQNFSFDALQATHQCVINIPTVEIAEKVVGVGNTTGKSVDKFETFGLTPKPASLVTPPLIAECYANLECKVIDTQLVNRYNFFVLEVVKAWLDHSHQDPRTLHHRGEGYFMIAGETIKLPSKMK